MTLFDYIPPPPIHQPWPDRLGRRLSAACKRENILSLCDDGRIALALSSKISILSPSVLFRFQPPPAECQFPISSNESKKPFEYSILLDKADRISRLLRPPTIGHSVICAPLGDRNGKWETEFGGADVAFVRFAPCELGGGCMVVMGEGSAFWIVPRFGEQGGWGGVLGRGAWKCRQMFPEVGGVLKFLSQYAGATGEADRRKRKMAIARNENAGENDTIEETSLNQASSAKVAALSGRRRVGKPRLAKARLAKESVHAEGILMTNASAVAPVEEAFDNGAVGLEGAGEMLAAGSSVKRAVKGRAAVTPVRKAPVRSSRRKIMAVSARKKDASIHSEAPSMYDEPDRSGTPDVQDTASGLVSRDTQETPVVPRGIDEVTSIDVYGVSGSHASPHVDAIAGTSGSVVLQEISVAGEKSNAIRTGVTAGREQGEVEGGEIAVANATVVAEKGSVKKEASPAQAARIGDSKDGEEGSQEARGTDASEVTNVNSVSSSASGSGEGKVGSEGAVVGKNVEDSRPPKRRRGRDRERISCFPKTQVQCVVFTRVARRKPEEDEWANYVVFGRKDKTVLYAVTPWSNLHRLSAPALELGIKWTTVIECLPGVTVCGDVVTLIAIGGADEQLRLYGLRFKGEELTAELLWKAERSLFFGYMSSLCWNFGPPFQSNIMLVVACGETVVILDWGNLSAEMDEGWDVWKNCEVHRIEEAHNMSVSSVKVLMDGSVVTAGIDGTVFAWTFEDPEGEEENMQKLSRADIVRDSSIFEPVMCMERTMNGFGIITLTSKIRSYGEMDVDEDEVVNERGKYCAGSQRSVIGLNIQPPSFEVSEVKRHLISTISALSTSTRHAGQAVALWDIELFMQQFEIGEEDAILCALRTHVSDMVERAKRRGFEKLTRRMYGHYLRVGLAVSQIIRRIGGSDMTALEEFEVVSGEIGYALRSLHYDACLVCFLESGQAASLTLEECRALDCMCQFLTLTNAELLWKAEETVSRVEAVRKVVFEWQGEGDKSVTPCDICLEDMFIPLMCDSEDATWFYCPSGDVFTRCVLTGLPCADVVPLMCHNCDAKAIVGDFNPFGKGEGTFGWVVDVGSCPLCLGSLLPANVETQ